MKSQLRGCQTTNAVNSWPVQLYSTESGARETIWSQRRRIENCIREMWESAAFAKGCEYAKRPFPVALSTETVDTIQMVLTAELARLNEKAL